MRLKSIKLAGFKSFVDPTTVQFPGNMCAVVGPNGCGKSNIIDAVRWVMGESSAKTLRGESMTDVIFNGTTSRQPVSQASIELVFDNAQGKVAGNLALSVVENQFDGRLTDGLATGGAIENDIGHRLAAQGLRGALAHYPSDGVDNVGLAAAVRADYRTHVARKLNRGGIDKRLKTGQFYGFQAHY